MFKGIPQVLAAAGLLWLGLGGAAVAQTSTQSSSSTTMTTTTNTSEVLYYSADRWHDAELTADWVALQECYERFDRQIKAMLEKGQANEFNNFNHDTNVTNWSQRRLTRANVNGFVAFLETRLHLYPGQEDRLYWIERDMYAQASKLQLAYENRLAYLESVAVQQTTTTTTTTETVAVPPAPDVAPAVAPVAPAPEPEPAPKKMIRNTDLK